jgi:hypothetical protein
MPVPRSQQDCDQFEGCEGEGIHPPVRYVARQSDWTSRERAYMGLDSTVTNGLEVDPWAAYCLHFAYYNFCPIHRTLRGYASDGSGDHRSCMGSRGASGVG